MKTGLLRQFISWLESGEKSERELVALCLDRIGAEDPGIRAWVEVASGSSSGKGPLCGIPFGAKDIFDTLDFPTAYGSPLFAGRRTDVEAGLITQLRECGAVLIGKTQTAAFAYYDPPPTRNPRDLTRTPGGSSSGSAAAVASGMVPFTLGTQTQGSILRPASYCGICGFKPTFGLLPMGGILPFAPSLDTPGFFTETADDMQLLWKRLGSGGGTATRRLGSLLRPAPVVNDWLIDEIELPFSLDEVLRSVQVINAYEGARTHQERWIQYGNRLGPKLSQLVKDGLAISTDSYQSALGTLANARAAMAGVYREYPVLVSAAATGPAPASLASTGDPRMNAPWSGLHGPAIAIPVPGEGLPIGFQLTAAVGNDDVLVETASLLEFALNHAFVQTA
jgi:Asp-tRNA(Asn)/Glu-tRNA(Gln) amidotransferase A subunit family amidase